MSDKYLSGRAAMVTGGASGMGRAMALAFANAGADVALGSLLAGGPRTEGEVQNLPGADELEATRAEVEACGVKCIGVGLDVCSMDSVQAFYDATVAAFGKADILANAAGITAEHTICGHTDALWDKVVDVNLNGTYRTIKLCLPGMMERKWGRIVNIASTAANVGAPMSGAYCASKAGVVGLTRAVAMEGAPNGVSCNAISPTWVETKFGVDWMSGIAEDQEGRSGAEYIADVKAANPQGRLVQPTEIGALAAFLCREEAFGITMENLTISAGSLW